MNFKTCIVDDTNQKQGLDMIELMREYAQDPMGGKKDLSEDVKNNLVASPAQIPSVFSVIAYIDKKPAGLINCFEGFSTFNCKPLVNIHDVIVSAN